MVTGEKTTRPAGSADRSGTVRPSPENRRLRARPQFRFNDVASWPSRNV